MPPDDDDANARSDIHPPGGRSGIGRHRWLVCGLLFFATTVNYFDRQILSLLKPLLDEQLKWTNEQFGQVNAAFQGAYGLGLALFGAFIDRAGTRVGYAASIAAWSLAAACHALVGSVGGFATARVALGLGEGGNFPSAIKAVALWFPKRERAYATALFNSGANVGATRDALITSGEIWTASCGSLSLTVSFTISSTIWRLFNVASIAAPLTPWSSALARADLLHEPIQFDQVGSVLHESSRI